MRHLTVIFLLLALPQIAGAQAVTFEREGVEYRLEAHAATGRRGRVPRRALDSATNAAA